MNRAVHFPLFVVLASLLVVACGSASTVSTTNEQPTPFPTIAPVFIPTTAPTDPTPTPAADVENDGETVSDATEVATSEPTPDATPTTEPTVEDDEEEDELPGALVTPAPLKIDIAPTPTPAEGETQETGPPLSSPTVTPVPPTRVSTPKPPPPPPAPTSTPVPPCPNGQVFTRAGCACPAGTAARASDGACVRLCELGDMTIRNSCVCTGIYFDNGGQCIERCSGGLVHDNFGRCGRPTTDT